MVAMPEYYFVDFFLSCTIAHIIMLCLPEAIFMIYSVRSKYNSKSIEYIISHLIISGNIRYTIYHKKLYSKYILYVLKCMKSSMITIHFLSNIKFIFLHSKTFCHTYCYHQFHGYFWIYKRYDIYRLMFRVVRAL